MLLTVDPRDRREEGVEDEEEVPEAPAMLWVEGEAGGRRWDVELERWVRVEKLQVRPLEQVQLLRNHTSTKPFIRI